MILEIDNKIISSDILTVRFCCDLAKCQGICCVEGNSGAPLEPEEVDRLEEEYEAYMPYMTLEGIKAVESQGFFVVDEDGDLTTPLVGEEECAYTYTKDGVTLCAIEKAYREGKTGFKKPISCHLYPIRLATFRDGSVGLNYHRWSVCGGALEKGEAEGILMYHSLREPITRRFGEEFYRQLEAAAEAMKKERKGLE